MGLHERLLERLTASQREAVVHEEGPLLIIAGAGTGKTTVITHRIAWLIATKRARPEEILALTFTDKAAAQMEDRVDLLVPYGYLGVALKTFHAFGDELLRDHALKVGLSPKFRVLTQAEQAVFLRRHIFELPLEQFRPLNDPTRYVEALATVFARAKDEAVFPEEFIARADQDQRVRELAHSYAAYERLLRQADTVDFGNQVLLAMQLLERHPEALAALQRRFRYILIDEFQDTNYAQFRLLQLLAHPQANITVVADDDQSIYKWRGAAISNVLKFLEHYASVRTVVLTENFRSSQPLLDCAYRLIRFNDPDRLEVRQGIDKRLVAQTSHANDAPHLLVFDTASSEADWVARTIRQAIESGAPACLSAATPVAGQAGAAPLSAVPGLSACPVPDGTGQAGTAQAGGGAGRRRAGDFAILVRSNRAADLFLRALNVAGVPWQFSGASGLFAREETKMLLSCLKTLADPDDSLSWYHVASSPLYRCPMRDLATLLARAQRTNQAFSRILEQMESDEALAASLSEEGKQRLTQLKQDVNRLLERSRTHSSGQLLYQWLLERGVLTELGRGERLEDALQLQTIARFFNQLQRVESLVGTRLPELVQHLELFQALGNEPVEEDDAWADRVSVLTIHKAKGLEFPVVFLVGLVQGRFPTAQRKDPIELPEALIKDLLPSGDYHLQEERRLFYVGMTRAKEQLYVTCAYDYGGKTVRKVSQFVLEALDLASPSPPAKSATAKELLERSAELPPLPIASASSTRQVLRLDPHGVDDYATCPLKYRYSHILKIPVMRHHLVIYGSALHKAVEQFFTRRLHGSEMSEEELVRAFENSWISEGFLTREHEELRLAQGRKTLRRFYASQQETPERPTLIEEKFRFPLDDILVVGRWDRIDRHGDEAVIIDYKSSDIREQAIADRRTRESLQLLIYALAWFTLYSQLPTRVELHFLETGLIGQAQFTEHDLDRARAILRETAQAIRAGEFQARPQEHSCRWCAFQSICPFAFSSPVFV